MISLHVVFRFLNFFLLMALFYYVYIYFIVPAVKKMIELYDQILCKLQDDRKMVQLDCQLIINSTKEQKKQFELIETKFLLWQKKSNEQDLLQLAERKKIEQAISSRFDIRSQVVMNEFAKKEQLPYILDRVTQELQVKYQAIEPQKKYIDDLVDVMKEQL